MPIGYLPPRASRRRRSQRGRRWWLVLVPALLLLSLLQVAQAWGELTGTASELPVLLQWAAPGIQTLAATADPPWQQLRGTAQRNWHWGSTQFQVAMAKLRRVAGILMGRTAPACPGGLEPAPPSVTGAVPVPADPGADDLPDLDKILTSS